MGKTSEKYLALFTQSGLKISFHEIFLEIPEDPLIISASNTKIKKIYLFFTIFIKKVVNYYQIKYQKKNVRFQKNAHLTNFLDQNWYYYHDLYDAQNIQ
jgi:hypothetical protein